MSTDIIVNNTSEKDNAQTTDSSINKKDVAYVYSDTYLKQCDQLHKVPKRASMTHSLIASYGLLSKMRLIEAKPAQEEDIATFHSADYIQTVKRLSEEDDDEKLQKEAEEFGLTYDCPAFPGVYEYACFVAGASLRAAQCLTKGVAQVAINWPGGWHHAKRDEASGFCYFNDIVIAILKLREKFERVLYIDVDLHHGDGVEDAFCATNKVYTLSFHKYSPGFFPGSGNIRDIGMGKGKNFTFNVPLMDGVTDEQYIEAFKRIVERVRSSFRPEAVVCQCGADGLAHDPHAKYNLTPAGLAECVQHVQDWGLPLLLLGGGGYNVPNTARCWTQITAQVLGETLPADIPEHEFFTEYGPAYELSVDPANMINKNKEGFLDRIYQLLEENLDEVNV